MHSPLISKIRCNHPNKKGSRNANRNHLIYIATREGVDLSPLSDGTPARSGLFGNFDISDVQSAGNSLYQLSAEGTPIFRGIVSLSSEDAAKLGYTTKAAWELYMKDVMPDIGREFNIPVDKLLWTAAVHMENGHPHCHYMFWRNDHKTQSCFIHPSRQNKCRELLSARMFEDERQQQILNKTASRDSILKLEKEVLGKVRAGDLKNVSEMLLDLCHDLPQTGRLNYKFLPPELKHKVDHISDILFQNTAIQKKATEYSLAVKRLSETYSPSESHHKVNVERAQTDLYTRSGNIILKEAKAILSALTPELPFPQNMPGILYSDKSNIEKTLKLLTPLANDNHVYSQLMLGKLYAQHDTDYFNPDLAHNYLKKAYESGLEFSQYQLAKFYLDKNTSFYSPEKALSLLQPLAESGNDFAQTELGCLYLWGNHTNIPKNTSLAFYWLNLARLQNNSFAQNNIDLYNRVTLQSFAYKIYNSIFHDLSSSTLRRSQRLEDLKYYQSLSAEHKRAKQHERQI